MMPGACSGRAPIPMRSRDVMRQSLLPAEVDVKTRKPKTLLMKYHENADQQPMSTKAAEKLGIFPSLPLASLAAMLRHHDYPVKVLDLHALNIMVRDAATLLLDDPPDIVGITCKTLGWPSVLQIAQMVKATLPQCLVVVGGPHTSIYAKESLTWDCIDLAVVGDGEDTLLDIVRTFEGGGDLTSIMGTCAKRAGQIVMNPARPVQLDLDVYPMPALDLLPMSRYHAMMVHKPFSTMVSTRGCPWHCGFCSQVYTSKLRYRSVQAVVDEMQWHVERFGIKEIVMFDETFTVGRSRVLKLCDEIINRKLRVAFNIRARVDTVDKPMLQALKAAGCRSIHMGVEGGSQRMLDIMKKGITVEQVQNAFTWSKEVGLETRGYFMIGYYDASPEDVEDVISFSASLPLDWASYSVATPLPATELYDVAIERGYLSGDYWREYTLKGGGPVPHLTTETLDAATLRSFRTKAYMNFYLRPHIVLNRLYSASRSIKGMLDLMGGATVLKEIAAMNLRERGLMAAQVS